MAVFIDTGNGDIYAGPTRSAAIAAWQKDCDDFDESEAFEVSGTTKMAVSNDEATEEMTTLDEEYDETLGSYCIASTNF